MSEELSLCPFCGGQLKLEGDRDYGVWFVHTEDSDTCPMHASGATVGTTRVTMEKLFRMSNIESCLMIINFVRRMTSQHYGFPYRCDSAWKSCPEHNVLTYVLATYLNTSHRN